MEVILFHVEIPRLS